MLRQEAAVLQFLGEVGEVEEPMAGAVDWEGGLELGRESRYKISYRWVLCFGGSNISEYCQEVSLDEFGVA